MTAATPTLTIATRESRLALWQAEHVLAALQAQGHRVAVLGMTTLGDQILDRSLSKVGGKGLFVKELEAALLDGRADLAVHSLKDVPMALPNGLVLGAVLAREDARDAWVSPHCASLAELPPAAVVGTSSLRRLVLLRALLDAAGRTDVRIEPLRGNLDTRLRKLDSGDFAAIVLAAAGLQRLGLQARIRHCFEPSQMLPAAGQGALGIELLAARPDVQQALRPLVHAPSWAAVAAERAVSRALGGSCSVPLAAYATWVQGPLPTGAGVLEFEAHASVLHLQAAWGDPSGVQPLLRAQASAPIANLAQAEALGVEVAHQLLHAGARASAV